MLSSIQFPLADSRFLAGGDLRLLGRPTWPSVAPDVDFVRSFGTIRKRRLGGVADWGEGAICEADRAVRFQRLPPYLVGRSPFPLGLAYRRFYFDGMAVGKFEVGITSEIDHLASLDDDHVRNLFTHLLNLQVKVPALPAKAVTNGDYTTVTDTILGRLGKPLARLYSGSTISHPPPVSLQNWWVVPGDPLLFSVVHDEWDGTLPSRQTMNMVKGIDISGCRLLHHHIPFAGKQLRVWHMIVKKGYGYRDVRTLKISLLRLHAEHHTLRTVLQHISTGKITVTPRSPESGILQTYLNDATRRISRLDKSASRQAGNEVVEIARASDEAANPGARDALLDSLRILDVRKNIFQKVQDYIVTNNYYGETVMGSKYDFSNSENKIAAVGDNAFGIWNEGGGDLTRLRDELARLRAELEKRASSPEEKEAVEAVQQAENAAAKDDGAGAFGFLKKAGAWALDVAKSIGVPVAVEVLKKTMAG